MTYVGKHRRDPSEPQRCAGCTELLPHHRTDCGARSPSWFAQEFGTAAADAIREANRLERQIQDRCGVHIHRQDET